MADEQTLFLSTDETTANEEAARIDGYRKVYNKTHPEPKRKSPKFWATLGMEAAFITAASVAAVLLAGLRTYDAFSAMFTSANTPPFLTFIGSVAAMVAVEGLLMATGLITGKEKGTKLSTAGTVTAFVISIAAGLVVSLGPIRDAVAGMFSGASYILAFSTAIGASILTYIGGLVSGSILYKWAGMQTNADTDYQTAMTAWNQAIAQDYRRRGGKIFGTPASKLEVQSSVVTELDTKVSERVQEWLTLHGISVFEVGVGQLVTPQTIAEDLGFPDSGSVRTVLSRLRKKAQSTPIEEAPNV